MKEISKIRINEKTYILKDEKARDLINKANNLIVTTTANPISPKEFICDYSYSEIRNALIADKTVVMYFEDTIEKSGNQVYPFLKLTNDGAYFRRVQVSNDFVRQIDIKVDNGRNVTFTEIKFGNLSTANDEINNLTAEVSDNTQNINLINRDIELIKSKLTELEGGKK